MCTLCQLHMHSAHCLPGSDLMCVRILQCLKTVLLHFSRRCLSHKSTSSLYLIHPVRSFKQRNNRENRWVNKDTCETVCSSPFRPQSTKMYHVNPGKVDAWQSATDTQTTPFLHWFFCKHSKACLNICQYLLYYRNDRLIYVHSVQFHVEKVCF